MWVKLKGVKSKLTWSLIGNLVFALSQWMILSLLARFGSAIDLGIYTLGLALTAPVVQFFSFELRTVLATDSKSQYSFQQYFGSRVIHLLIGYLIIIPIALFYSRDTITTWALLLIGLIKIFEALSDLCMGFYQKKSRIDLIGKSQFYRGIFSLIISFSLYSTTQNINIMLIGLLFVMVLRFLYYDINHLRNYTKTNPIYDLSAFKLIKLFLPLGITALISSLVPNVPRYFLDYFVGVEAVGIYSALYYILVAGNMFFTPISMLAAPKIAMFYNDKSKMEFLKLVTTYIIIAMILSTVFIVPICVSGEYILSLLYGDEFVAYYNAFTIISITLILGFVNSILNLSVVASREVGVLPLVNSITVLVSIIVGYFLIKNFSIEGAAWTLLISRIIQTLLYTSLFANVLKRK